MYKNNIIKSVQAEHKTQEKVFLHFENKEYVLISCFLLQIKRQKTSGNSKGKSVKELNYFIFNQIEPLKFQ